LGEKVPDRRSTLYLFGGGGKDREREKLLLGNL